MISRMVGFPIYQISFKNRKQIFSKNVINIDYDDDIYNYKKIAEVTIDFLTKRSSKVRP